MNIKKIFKKPDTTLLILLAMVVIALAAAFWIGGWQMTFNGLKRSVQLIETVWLRLLLGLAMGGLIQVLIPRDLIAKWLGPTSGIKGLLIGSYTGVVVSGGPFIILPIIASIYKAGAGVGPIIALLTGAQLLGIQGLIVWQIPFLGTGIPLARYIVCVFIPPLVGLIGNAVFRLMTRSPQVVVESDRSGESPGEGSEKEESRTIPEEDKE